MPDVGWNGRLTRRVPQLPFVVVLDSYRDEMLGWCQEECSTSYSGHELAMPIMRGRPQRRGKIINIAVRGGQGLRCVFWAFSIHDEGESCRRREGCQSIYCQGASAQGASTATSRNGYYPVVMHSVA